MTKSKTFTAMCLAVARALYEQPTSSHKFLHLPKKSDVLSRRPELRMSKERVIEQKKHIMKLDGKEPHA